MPIPEEVKKSKEIITNILKNAGWKIRKAAGTGEYIYTTTTGRESTLCLLNFENSSSIWRWHIDRNSVRVWGRHKMVNPKAPSHLAGDNQITAYVDELPALAEWLANWMIAADANQNAPACPIILNTGQNYLGGYSWTTRASENYKPGP